ncbi:leucyl/phenylalanyl-tRNA--protein transferase [Gammaproteobacteria bacterium]|nr:leucyl/phenylalanyl-tRNA--protein transferase [Gammaproteobacteria bacterium]
MSDTSGTSPDQIKLTPEIILKAYSLGMFPMAKNRYDDELFWVDPEFRGIIPLDNLHISRSLRKQLRNNTFTIRYSTDFYSVIMGCAGQTDGRRDTWINSEIIALYSQLFDQGFVQTVECWQDGVLVGGLYGISMKGAFFGESMFSHKSNASKIALIHLIARLNEDKFTLLDTQFITDHLSSLGAIEITRSKYLLQLDRALSVNATFNKNGSQLLHQKYIDKLLQNQFS